MTPIELIESIHQENEQRASRLTVAINNVENEMTQMARVINYIADYAPHQINHSITFKEDGCQSTCAPCLAKRFLESKLTENDLKLLKGEK